MAKNLKEERLGATNYNNQGCLMKVVEYNGVCNVVVEFQDEYKCKIKTRWDHFQDGTICNPYYPTVLGVGMIGVKYQTRENGCHTKEYLTWSHMLRRCYVDVQNTDNTNIRNRNKTYNDVTCCEEWLLFENFYEWLHSQENFKVWKQMPLSAIDKDILIKGNKVYSPNTCCLVPNYVNLLFIKSDATRGNLPIGVSIVLRCKTKKYRVRMSEYDKTVFIGQYADLEEAFQAYKQHKEAYIKQVAQEEYNKGTISKKCYEAMMKWEVEITD
jgi:hypothetical protein